MRRSAVCFAFVSLLYFSGTGPCWAAPLESHIPAGQTGTLEIQVLVSGQLEQRKIDREMKMVLQMVSEETAAQHLLSTGPDEDMQKQMAHMDEVAAASTGGEDLMMEAGKAMEAVIAACEGNEGSAACASAQQRFQAANAKVEAMAAASQAKMAQAPEITSQNRYQSWAASYDRGCGTLVAKIRDGRSLQEQGELKLPLSAKPEDRLPVCGSRLVLDRRAQMLSLAVNPISVPVPRKGQPPTMGEGLIDFTDLDPSIGADVDAWAGVLFLRGEPIKGSEQSFSGTKTYRSERGVVTQVSWTFRQD